MRKQIDVLVIGGGIAGLMASISARQGGAAVSLLSKHPIGRSGNTLVSGGGIAAATANPQNTPEAFFADILDSGKGLANPKLARMLANKSPEMVERLLSLGVKFVRTEDDFKYRRPPGHQVARNIPTDWEGFSYLNRGLSFTLPLVEDCMKHGVQMQEGWAVTSLISNGGCVCGAYFQNRRGESRKVYASQVILATGGMGALFAKTNNTSDIQGDGLGLALEVGCRLQDMEQVQFYPTMMFAPVKMTVSNPLFGLGAVLRNKSGEQFMQNYDPDGDMATRDVMARAIFMEIESGRGIEGSVYFDCTRIPRDILFASFSNFCHFLSTKGIDPSTDYLRVAPCAHYTLGGVLINENCETDVQGLLCAGEICGGFHGGNRLSGAALMEACVTGWQAGITATQKCFTGTMSGLNVAGELSPCTVPLSKSILSKIQNILWENVSLVRDRARLDVALASILEMKESFDARCPSALYVAEAIVKSAILREESRGAHFRSDFPNTNDRFLGNVISHLQSNQVDAQFFSRVHV